MKRTAAAIFLAVMSASSALAQDYKFSVTNQREEGHYMAPLVIVDAAISEPFLFTDGKLSPEFVAAILDGDPRPLNARIGAGYAGPVLGKFNGGPHIGGGETAEADYFITANMLRFYAKGGYGEGEDTLITGVWDIATGGGEVMLNLYDIGHSEGTNKLTLVKEGVARLVITPN
jgi:hypothetical protein